MIYKNTTIDPPGTIAHAKAMGAEILTPDVTFAQLIRKSGFPNRFKRFCCSVLKEYKVLDRSVQGIRRCESVKRAKRYKEPTECRFYGSVKDGNHVEIILPILEWTDEDIVAFIEDRHIKLHSLYYREDGTIDASRRLGCMCCPLIYYKKRQQQFLQYPRMVKFYLRNGEAYRKEHPNVGIVKKYESVYEWFYRELFFYTEAKWEEFKITHTAFDFKAELEKFFGLSL